MKKTERTIYKILKVANSLILLERLGRFQLPKDKTRTKALAHEVWRELDNAEKD